LPPVYSLLPYQTVVLVLVCQPTLCLARWQNLRTISSDSEVINYKGTGNQVVRTAASKAKAIAAILLKSLELTDTAVGRVVLSATFPPHRMLFNLDSSRWRSAASASALNHLNSNRSILSINSHVAQLLCNVSIN